MGTRRSSRSTRRTWEGRNRFEHWYRDNQVYFITARCRDRFPAFATDAAAAVFWDRFEHYRREAGFVTWVATLMNNHYHFLGYCRVGKTLGPMMRKLHGSVAKLVNDLLPERRVPFWRKSGTRDYFDGCLRDEKQCRRAYRYTLMQPVRAGLVRDWREYPHTKVWVELDGGVERALELGAFLEGVPNKRYEDEGRAG
jgi:REP element-mobilizing transposase RayT